MRRFVSVCTAALLVSCGPDVDRIEPAGSSQIVSGTQSCNYTGFCLTCGLGFDGSFSCGPKFSAFCTGSQSVTQEVTPVTVFYKDGTSRLSAQSRTLSTGSCG